MGRLPKRLTDNLPDLPGEFVEWLRGKGKQVLSLSELVEEFEEWKRKEGDGHDEES